MANFSKWIGATLGWSFGGPLGAALGFILGSVVDGVKFQTEPYNSPKTRQKTQTQSGDFEVSLLVLAAIVIKADGNIDQRELRFVRQQFISMYGKTRAANAFKLFNGIIKKNDISTRQISLQIRRYMDHPSRLQLLHFLFNIAKADGFVNDLEEEKIRQISSYLGINSRDYASIKAMFYDNSDAHYKILEISKSATDIEVKKAYRKMAKKYHPDKVRHLGVEHQKGAEEKFKQIQKAYETIQAERGL
jgi:DnaJ like chaperone protein